MPGQAVFSPSEIKVAVGVILFSLLWILLALPIFSHDATFLALNPIIQYFIINLGFICLSIAIFGVVFNLIITKEHNIVGSIVKGLALWFSFSFVIDMLQPPYTIATNGQSAITNPEALASASPDAMWAYIFGQVLPESLKTLSIPFVNISLIYLLVYIGIPLLTVLMVAIGLSEGEFLKWVRGGVNAK